MDKIVHYKIRHKETQLYSLGGSKGWSTEGKFYDKIGKLRAHLTNCINTNKRYPGIYDLANWEIIEYTLVPSEPKELHTVVTSKKLLELLKNI